MAPVLAWVMVAWIAFKAFIHTEDSHPRDRVRVPLSVIVWILGMLGMLVALIGGHLDFGFGLAQTIKSTIGWAKGWALLAIFPLIGAALPIRPQILYRASCRLGLQTLILVPLFLIAPIIHLPGTLFVSPLLALGGPGPDFFQVQLYGSSLGGVARWNFWTPWAPAAGFVASIYLIFALAERNWMWKAIGIAAALAMCLMSQSRLALIAMAITGFASWGLSNLTRPRLLMMGAFASVTLGILSSVLEALITEGKERFVNARPESSRVRSALARIAYQRWKDEAPIFGHGIVEKGPHLVEYMPIGSHHTWYGLLFVKGIVGFASLAIPMLWSTLEMLAKCQKSRTARWGLGVMITLWLYTFGENLEILVYLYWPGLVLVGIAARQRLRSPLATPLSGIGKSYRRRGAALAP
jgi:hypothetical protein